MAVELSVEARCQEVASRHEIGCALDGPGADDGNIIRCGCRDDQGNGPSASRTDADCVICRQREFGVVFINSEIGLRQHRESERIWPNASAPAQNRAAINRRNWIISHR